MKRWLVHFSLCIVLMMVLSGCSGIHLSSVLREIDKFGSSRKTTTVQRSASGKHIVRRGETVYRIAEAYGVPMRRIIEINRLRAPYTLRVGQRLHIPVAQSHTVRRGDTVYRIAKRYNVDMNALVRANNLRNPYTIHVGQRLRLPGQAVTTRVASKTTTTSKTKTPSGAKPVVSKPVQKPAPRPVSIPKPPPRKGQGLEWPVRGKVIVPYGSVAKGMRNDGINISAKLGTSIRAAEAGVVAYAGNELKGFGNMLLLKHDKGMITTYAHADQIKVKRGTVVKRGQIIASVGRTGNVTAPQLHFEVRQGSKAIDPMKYLR